MAAQPDCRRKTASAATDLDLGVAISQGCYATDENHERAVLRQLLGELDLEGVLFQADALHTQKPFFGSSRSREPTSSSRCSRRLLRRSKPTRRRSTARSSASSRESAGSLSWQRITRSATAATSPGSAPVGSWRWWPPATATASHFRPPTWFVHQAHLSVRHQPAHHLRSLATTGKRLLEH